MGLLWIGAGVSLCQRSLIYLNDPVLNQRVVCVCYGGEWLDWVAQIKVRTRYRGTQIHRSDRRKSLWAPHKYGQRAMAGHHFDHEWCRLRAADAA